MTDAHVEERTEQIAVLAKLCGWRVHTSGRGSTVATIDFNGDNERDLILHTTHPWESVEFNPFESITDAFMLVDALRSKGYMFDCGTRCANDSDPADNMVYAQFWQPGDDVDTVPHSIGVCFPEAISLAALDIAKRESR